MKPDLFAKAGAVVYVLWGLLHLKAAQMMFVLGESLEPGMVQARIFQNGWNLLIFAVFGMVIAVAMNPIPTSNPNITPPTNPVIPRFCIRAASTMDVISAVKKLMMNGAGEGLISSSVLPIALSHAFPNNGPYHNPPSG